jgi:hypothetical protein
VKRMLRQSRMKFLGNVWKVVEELHRRNGMPGNVPPVITSARNNHVAPTTRYIDLNTQWIALCSDVHQCAEVGAQATPCEEGSDFSHDTGEGFTPTVWLARMQFCRHQSVTTRHFPRTAVQQLLLKHHTCLNNIRSNVTSKSSLT